MHIGVSFEYTVLGLQRKCPYPHGYIPLEEGHGDLINKKLSVNYDSVTHSSSAFLISSQDIPPSQPAEQESKV